MKLQNEKPARKPVWLWVVGLLILVVLAANCAPKMLAKDGPSGYTPASAGGKRDQGKEKPTSLIAIWAGSGKGVNQLTGIGRDDSNNIYISGSFEGTIDLDPGSGSSEVTTEDHDVYLIKLDSSGSFIWERTWGREGESASWGIALDGSEGLYIAGRYSGTADLDPGPGIYEVTSTGGVDAYLIMLDSYGSFLRGHTWGGTGTDFAFGITLDDAGNIYITGHFDGTTDLDPGPGIYEVTSAGNSDAYLIKLDKSGSFLWGCTWGGTGTDSGNGIAIDDSYNIYITGDFTGTTDLKPGPGGYEVTSVDSFDSYLTKLDPTGSFLWGCSWGGTESDYALGIALDGSGNIYVTGDFSDTADLDPGPGSYVVSAKGDADAYLIKFDPFGSFLQGSTWGGEGQVHAPGIILDDSGNVIIIGHFDGTTDLDPGSGRYKAAAKSSNWDAYLIKLDPDGDLIYPENWEPPDEKTEPLDTLIREKVELDLESAVSARDKAMEAMALANLRSDPRFHFFLLRGDFSLAVSHSVVTVEGKLKTQSYIDDIISIIESTNGVKEVINNLEVDASLADPPFD